jgi:selenocysteine lyase/cysteine desulfurase
VLLDAAAFVPTNRLDLQVHSPDFVVMSFYKMFGYPTGVGCLLVRNETLATLRRPWFGGGTDGAGLQVALNAAASADAGAFAARIASALAAGGGGLPPALCAAFGALVGDASAAMAAAASGGLSTGISPVRFG